MPDTYAIGDHTTTHCAQCQLRQDHIIVAMDGAKITMVTCTTCENVVPFTPASAPPKARASRVKKGLSAARSVGPLWEAKMAVATSTAHPYTRTATYRIGDIVLHEQFGKGIVLKLAAQKCYVLFQDKERLMASGN